MDRNGLLHPETYVQGGNVQARVSKHFSPPSSITTPSTCSTCSIDDIPSDSEEGDGIVTWPWMQHIEENGDLLYVDSFCDDVLYSTPKETSNHVTKEGGIQRRLRNAMKKTSSSDIKQDYIKSSIRKNGVNHKSRQKTEASPPHPVLQKYEKIEKISENMNLISRNIILQLGDFVEKDFINLENVFGIISGLDLDTMVDEGDEKVVDQFSVYKRNLNSIVVQGIMPHSPAGRCQDILIDDVIVAVNSTEVDMRNIDSVLTQVNGGSEVVLRIERVVDGCPANLKSELCCIVSNDVWEGGEMVFQAFGEICAVMFLTLDTNDDQTESDILFWYPESPLVEKIKRVRGIFLTLHDIMINVTGTCIQSSVLVIDGKIINVCYEEVDSNVFVVAVPNDKCSIVNLRRKTYEFLQVLNVVYGNISRSFDKDMLPSTKHLVEKFTDLLLQPCEDNVNIGIRQLQLPLQQYVEISALLSDAEAADYGECANDFFPHRRLYSTIGSCLFYKDTLVCNHLCDSFLKVVVHVCMYHWLFMLVKKETLKQLIVWKELFLNQVFDNEEDVGTFTTDNDIRWFLLIVGQGRSLFCTLLQAGGAASSPVGNPGPHPFYVDSSWSILKYLLESIDIESICRTRLEGPSSPPIVTPSQILNPKTSQSPRALELTKRKVAANADTSTWHRNSFGDNEYPAFEKTDSRASSMSSGSSHVYLNGYNSFDTTSYKSVNTETSLNTTLSTKVTTGVTNSLFCFAVLQPYSGVFICPNTLYSNDVLSNDIMTSFKSSCENIHELFQAKEGCSRQLEHGILFNVESMKGAELKKGSPNVRYWVVGRLVKRGTREEEIYVCFEDGVPQNMIEMAFKMRFGCYY